MTEISSQVLFNPTNATVESIPSVECHLSQLRGTFADHASYDNILESGDDPLVYRVTSVTPSDGDGQLHYGIGMINPGQVGREYYMTRGHLHDWRIAAEIYIGLSGSGLMLLEDENTPRVQSIDLTPNSAIYVPGHTAHRTINIGSKPLTYLGIYPARAGHDYGAFAERNFSKVVIARQGLPVLLDRSDFLERVIQSRTEGR